MLTPQNYANISKNIQQPKIPVMTDLLHKHDDLRSYHSSTIPRNFDQFEQWVSLVRFDLPFSLEKSVHVEDVSSRLHFLMSQSDHRLVCFIVPILAHVPTWRFGAQEDESDDDERGQHG